MLSRLPLPKGHLSQEEFTRYELPVHLYVEALREGVLGIDNWSALLLHVGFMYQLGALRRDRKLRGDAANCIALLRSIVEVYHKTKQLQASEDQVKSLGRYMTRFGDYYSYCPVDQIEGARTSAAYAVVSGVLQTQ